MRLPSLAVVGLSLAGLGSGLACAEEGRRWISPPAAPPGTRTVFHAVRQGATSGLLVHAHPAPEPLVLPFELEGDLPARLQVIFTPYSLSQLDLDPGPPRASPNPRTSLSELEHQVWETDPSSDSASAWRSATIMEPAASLALAPRLCPEFEFEPLPEEASFVVAAHADRAGLVSPELVTWYKWKDGRLETEHRPIQVDIGPRSLGWFETDNAIWIGGPTLSRLTLSPTRRETFADFGEHRVLDLVRQGAQEPPRALVFTSDAVLHEVANSTISALGRIVTQQSSPHGSGGLAVAPREGRVFAAAAGSASVIEYGAGRVSVDPITTNDTEGFAFAATTANLGPILVSRPQGELYVRGVEPRWELVLRLGARLRRVADFGEGVIFFLADQDFVYFSPRTGACGVQPGPWGVGAQGARVGPHLLVAASEDGAPRPAWLVRMRPPE